MNRPHGFDFLTQLAGDLVGATLGAAKNDRLFGLFAIDQAQEQVKLQFRVDREVILVDRVHGGIAGRKIELLRVDHIAFRKTLDRRRNRGGEQ